MEAENEVLLWKCKECGKVLKSLYKRQLDFLIEQHGLVHSIADDKKKDLVV